MDNTHRQKPVLLVIDDSKTFLGMIKRPDLEVFFQIETILYQEGNKLETITQKIRAVQPDYLLLDVNLGLFAASQTILEEATSEGAIPPRCAIWIITQAHAGDEQRILSNYRQINIQTKNKLLTKPISAQTLRAELLDDSIYESRVPLDNDFPIPMRVLSDKGKVAFSNRGWQAAEHFPPSSDFPSWLEKGKIPNEKQYVGSFPGIPGEINAGYRVISFPLEQDGEQFLGQMVITIPVPDQVETLEDTLELIFTSMKAAGFHRGRYYQLTRLAKHTRQHEYDTLMELLQVSPQLKDPSKLPSQFPLTGELNSHFCTDLDINEFIGKGLEKELIYHIRAFEGAEQVEDERISELNELLEIKADTTPFWLEIPIYIRDYDLLGNSKEPGYRMAGLLIFDQHDPALQSDQFIDLEKITNDRIKGIEQLLLSLIYLLNQVLKNELDEKLREYEYSMRHLDKQLADEQDNHQRYKLILDALTEHCGADTAILAIYGHNSLLCTASKGKLPACIDGLRFPLQSRNYLLTVSFAQKREIVVQDDPAAPFQKEIYDHVTILQEMHLESEQREKFLEWLNSIHSAVAIPVMVGREEPIGSIALLYPDRWAISSRRMNSARAILHRIHWITKDMLRQEEQRSWEKIIGHDLRSSLHTIEQYKLIFAEQYPDIVADSKTWREMHFHLQDAIDQTVNLLKPWSDNMEQTYEDFSPGQIVKDYLTLSTGYQEETSVRCQIKPGWQEPAWTVSLHLNRDFFARIIRNLLQNSFKHGRRFVDRMEGEDTPVNVSIEAEVQDSRWQLVITNLGHMDLEDYETRFAERPRFRRMQDGAHIGLSAVKFWADKMGCDLSLENEGSNQVQAVLTYPVKKEENSG